MHLWLEVNTALLAATPIGTCLHSYLGVDRLRGCSRASPKGCSSVCTVCACIVSACLVGGSHDVGSCSYVADGHVEAVYHKRVPNYSWIVSRSWLALFDHVRAHSPELVGDWTHVHTMQCAHRRTRRMSANQLGHMTRICVGRALRQTHDSCGAPRDTSHERLYTPYKKRGAAH